MNPLSLTLRHCRTFEDFSLDFEDGLLAIIGQNGAGKSTIINAIDIALFGSRTLGSWYPRDGGTDPLQIELAFEHGGETYRVRRSYSPKGRGVSKTDLERQRLVAITSTPAGPGESFSWDPLTVESQTATNEQIEDLIGLSRDTFRASSFLAQGETGRFCDAQPRERKAILAEIMGLNDWTRHLERARAEKRVAEQYLERVAGVIEQAEGELAERSLVELERQEAARRVEMLDGEVQAATAALASARDRLAEAQVLMERRRNAQEAAQRAEQDLADAQGKLTERTDVLHALDARLESRSVFERAAAVLPRLEEEKEELLTALERWRAREALEREVAGFQSRIKAATARADELADMAAAVLDHNRSETCDRCGQTLGADAAARAAESYKAEAKERLAEASAAEAELSLAKHALSTMPTEKPDENRAQALAKRIDNCRTAQRHLAALEEAAGRRAELAEEISRIRAGLPEREEAAASARSSSEALGPDDREAERRHGGEVARLNVEVQRLNSERSLAAQASGRLEAQLERLDKLGSEVKAATARHDELTLEVGLLSHMEKAFGPNGVPALILENVAIPQIETEASRVLARLGGPAHGVELRTLRETKAGTVADALDVVCLTQDGDAPYETFSGGERARIAFALRLALAQLLANRKGSETGLLVIDELEGLDPEGIAALVSVLEELQTRIPKIIVVSHQAELRDAFERPLLLENVDGRTSIQSSTVEA